jgi:hypothetical protein
VFDFTTPAAISGGESYSPPDPPSTFTTREYTSQYDEIDFACSDPSCTQRFGSRSDLDRHYRTVHSNKGDRPYVCLREGCPADVKSWTTAGKRRAHNNKFHGPYSCPVLGCSRGFPHGFGSQNELDEHQTSEHGLAQAYEMPTQLEFSNWTSDSRGKGKAPSSNYVAGPNENVNATTFSMARTRLSPVQSLPISSQQNISSNHHIQSQDPHTKYERFNKRK